MHILSQIVLSSDHLLQKQQVSQLTWTCPLSPALTARAVPPHTGHTNSYGRSGSRTTRWALSRRVRDCRNLLCSASLIRSLPFHAKNDVPLFHSIPPSVSKVNRLPPFSRHFFKIRHASTSRGKCNPPAFACRGITGCAAWETGGRLPVGQSGATVEPVKRQFWTVAIFAGHGLLSP